MRVDFRSDTFTQPTDEMREAMKQAEVGDDIFLEDKTVQKLESLGAEMAGMEAGLFVSSGTMGNLIALMVHCERGDEVLLGDQSHIYYYEQGGISSIAGVIPKTLHNSEDGTIDLSLLKGSLRPENIHFPETTLICLESTHNRCNGSPLSLDYMESVYNFSRDNNLKIHLDGARVFNSVAYLGCELKDILKFVDSCMFCLSKGLASPVGSLLVGSRKFIEKARRVRKLLGGGMRQVGVIAAPGIISLREISKKVGDDNRRAYELAKFINSKDGFSVKLDRVKTNIFYIECEGLAAEVVERLASYDIHAFAVAERKIRFVTHYMVSDESVLYVKDIFNRYF